MSQRFGIDLFIVHPSMAAEFITKTLGIIPHTVHDIGHIRVAPNGTIRPGRYKDTRWRYSICYETEDQHFESQIVELITQLKPHRNFIRKIVETGGSASINLSFLGDDGHFGDSLSIETLSTLVDLKIRFGISYFSVPQIFSKGEFIQIPSDDLL